MRFTYIGPLGYASRTNNLLCTLDENIGGHIYTVTDYSLYRSSTKLGMVTYMGERLVLGGQPRRPSQDGVSLADPNFAGSPLRTRLDLEQPNSAW